MSQQLARRIGTVSALVAAVSLSTVAGLWPVAGAALAEPLTASAKKVAPEPVAEQEPGDPTQEAAPAPAPAPGVKGPGAKAGGGQQETGLSTPGRRERPSRTGDGALSEAPETGADGGAETGAGSGPPRRVPGQTGPDKEDAAPTPVGPQPVGPRAGVPGAEAPGAGAPKAEKPAAEAPAPAPKAAAPKEPAPKAAAPKEPAPKAAAPAPRRPAPKAAAPKIAFPAPKAPAPKAPAREVAAPVGPPLPAAPAAPPVARRVMGGPQIPAVAPAAPAPGVVRVVEVGPQLPATPARGLRFTPAAPWGVAAAPAPAEAAAPSDPPPLGTTQGEVTHVLSGLATGTAEAVIRTPGLPLGMLAAVLVFLLLHGQIDRRDPKIAAVRIEDDEPLEFGRLGPVRLRVVPAA